MDSPRNRTNTLPRLPELLSPAGSPDALEAALAAGADAVYLGGGAFNARMNARNFDRAELTEAVATAHRLGGRVYLTLNTLIWDRELTDAVQAAYEAAVAGVDALIIADAGAAACIHQALPSLPLHASTQFSGHNSRMGQVLAPFGFSRFVIARETPLCDLKTAVRNSPLEIEVFIHGALCVCHSGQCLFSSVVGGRSGNRGACAQPCRLPYTAAHRPAADPHPPRRTNAPSPRAEDYPLSLKDLSLARHVPALIDTGVASLKIEGRMKSAGYVGGVTAIWRRLLDERRAATEEEMQTLADLFSRGGFTDGYFTGNVDHRMMGIRSETDKERTSDTERAAAGQNGSYLPLTLHASVRAGEPMTLTATAPLFRQDSDLPTATTATESETVPETETETATETVTVRGDIPARAQNPAAALTEETLTKQLTRLGGTPYRPAALTVDLDPGLILPVSRLNALRRAATDALDAARLHAMPRPATPYRPEQATAAQPARHTPSERPDAPHARSACFRHAGQITPAAKDYFPLRFLPLTDWAPKVANGVILPPVIFDHESGQVKAMLTEAIRSGARHILVGNPGHFPLLRETLDAMDPSAAEGLTFHGDFRLNVTNLPALDRICEMANIALSDSSAAQPPALADVILSPELTLPRLRDLHAARPDRVRTIVYGRLPLMLLEKCAIRALYPDARDPKKSNGHAGTACALCAKNAAALTDRKGKVFPLVRTFNHRNLILNSLPLSMTDRADDLARAAIFARHYLFTTESAQEVDRVIQADRHGTPIGGDIKRLK